MGKVWGCNHQRIEPLIKQGCQVCNKNRIGSQCAGLFQHVEVRLTDSYHLNVFEQRQISEVFPAHHTCTKQAIAKWIGHNSFLSAPNFACFKDQNIALTNNQS